MAGKRRRKAPAIAIGLILAGAAAFCGWQAFGKLDDYKAAEAEYEAIAAAHTAVDLDALGAPSRTDWGGGGTDAEDRPYELHVERPDGRRPGIPGEDYPDLGIDHAGLLAEAQDYKGWLHIDDGIAGIGISYPIMQGTDNEFYLHHTPSGAYSSAGSVFLDYHVAGDFSEHSTVMYAHNMLNDSMFSQLKKYRNTSSQAQERYFYIYLPDNSVMKCRVYSTHIAKFNSDAYQALLDDEQYAEYWDLLQSLSEEDWGYHPEEIPDKTVTLSTCFGRSGTKNRMAVHAAVTDWFLPPETEAADESK